MSDYQSPSHHLSLIITAYNEEEALPKLVAEIIRDMAEWEQLEIIIVDDGSTDQTSAIMKELSQTQHQKIVIKLVYLTYNQGMGAALKAGFKEATMPWVTFLPGDGQIEPQMIAKLCDLADPNTTLITSRYSNREYTPYRWLLSKGLRVFTFLIIWMHVTSEGMYLIRRDFLQALKPISDSFMLNLEIPIRVIQAHKQVKVAEIEVRDRQGGISRATQAHRIMNTFKDIICLRWRMLIESWRS